MKAPPLSRRRMTPPTPFQNSYSFEEEQGAFRGGRADVECERQNDHLQERDCSWNKVTAGKVEVEELESRCILEESWKKQGTKTVARQLRPSAQDGSSEFLVVSRSRWDEHQRWLNAPWR